MSDENHIFLSNLFKVFSGSFENLSFYEQVQIVGIFSMAFARLPNETSCRANECSSVQELAEVCTSCPIKTPQCHLKLSQKEKECLHYLCEGLTIKGIARKMKVSPRTVETHLERAKDKLHCHNKAQLVLMFSKTESVI